MDSFELSKPKDYDEGLKKFVRSILYNIETNENIINKLTDDMSLWEIAFTHITFNPNQGENYEVYEKVGDAVMKLTFTEFLFNKYENITQSEIGNYQIYYLSRTEQARISYNLKIPKYILSALDKTADVLEDTLEAFFGALQLIGNNIKPAYGYLLCYNLTIFIFNDVDIIKEGKMEPIGMELKEKLEKFGLSQKPYEEWTKDENKSEGKMRIGFTDNDIEKLKKYGINISDRFLGTSAFGENKTKAREKASKKFLERLNKLLETKSWIKYIKEIGKKNEDLNLLLEKAEKIASKIGYYDLELVVGKSTRGFYVQLIGAREDDDKLVTLYIVSDNEKIKQSKMRLLEEFIRKYK